MDAYFSTFFRMLLAMKIAYHIIMAAWIYLWALDRPLARAQKAVMLVGSLGGALTAGGAGYLIYTLRSGEQALAMLFILASFCWLAVFFKTLRAQTIGKAAP